MGIQSILVTIGLSLTISGWTLVVYSMIGRHRQWDVYVNNDIHFLGLRQFVIGLVSLGIAAIYVPGENLGYILLVVGYALILLKLLLKVFHREKVLHKHTYFYGIGAVIAGFYLLLVFS